jgi:hypothetical protein
MSEARNDVERNWGEHSPAYYRAMEIQPTDYIVANRLEYLPASVVKYASRAGRKPGEPALKDAKKCLAFVKRWVAELEREAAEQAAPAEAPQPAPQPVERVQEAYVIPQSNGEADVARGSVVSARDVARAACGE